ncbi:helix-turn-helix domain-containing protein [Microbacterium elymi]|uniref:helix-turn-helix domain-containing protein n=1 Tax=Microbacterium elymi TaxID=2909587 RepID=UPI00338E4AE9
MQSKYTKSTIRYTDGMESEDGMKPFLNVRETAKLLGVHENTVRNWVTAGTLVSARVPGSTQASFCSRRGPAPSEGTRLKRFVGRTRAPHGRA